MTALLFVKKYWKHLLVVAALLIVVFYVKGIIEDYGQRQYEKGKQKADAIWTEKWDEEARRHNKEVEDLKAASTKASEELKKENKKREADLKKIIDDLKAKNPNKSDWIPDKNTVCTSAASESSKTESKPLYDPVDGLLSVPLGETFVDTWNTLNQTLSDTHRALAESSPQPQ